MLDGIFLRGDKAAVLNDPEYADSGEVNHPAGIHIKNLGVYEGPVRYDGYVALARHAFAKQSDEPLAILSNVDPSDTMYEFGIVARLVLDKDIPEDVRSIITDLNNSKYGIIVSYMHLKPRLNANFASTFVSVEGWVSGDEGMNTPFQGCTERDTCDRYKRVLFFDKPFLKGFFLDMEDEDRRDDLLSEYELIQEVWPETPMSLRDVVEKATNIYGDEDDLLYKMKEKFVSWNKRDRAPPVVRRTTITTPDNKGGGANETGSAIRFTNATTPNDAYYDTDPIFTIAMMIMTLYYSESREMDVLEVFIIQHGIIDARTKAFNYVPNKTTVRTTYPGYISSNARSLFKKFEIFHKRHYLPNVRTGVAYDKVTYESGNIYRDVSLALDPILMTIFKRGYTNGLLLMWSMYIMYKLYRLTDSRVQTLGHVIKFVKETFFWYDSHFISINSCQCVSSSSPGENQTRVRAVYDIYWANFEFRVLSAIFGKIYVAPIEEGADLDNEEVARLPVMGRPLSSIRTGKDINDLFAKVFETMPPEFRDAPIISDREAFPAPGAKLDDIMKLGKLHFLKHYLGIDVEAWTGDPLDAYDNNDSDIAFEIFIHHISSSKNLHPVFNLFEPMRDLSYAPVDENNVTANDVVEGLYDVFGISDEYPYLSLTDKLVPDETPTTPPEGWLESGEGVRHRQAAAEQSHVQRGKPNGRVQAPIANTNGTDWLIPNVRTKFKRGGGAERPPLMLLDAGLLFLVAVVASMVPR